MLVLIRLLSYYSSATSPLDADIAAATAVVVLFILFNPTNSLRPADVPACKISLESSNPIAVTASDPPYKVHLALGWNNPNSSKMQD